MGTSGGTVAYADSDVERVRRAHQNDLENIPLLFGHPLLLINQSFNCCGHQLDQGVHRSEVHTYICLLEPGPTTIEGAFIHPRPGHHPHICGATALHYM